MKTSVKSAAKASKKVLTKAPPPGRGAHAKPFQSVLIANRGEIACRLIAACKALGLKTAAVYSEADKDARHVRLADRSFCIGPGPATESYLSIPKLLEAARATGAQAVHPGYGFLSERSAFAAAVQKAGLVWIGPSPEAIELLGNKIAAKNAAEKAGVPTLPWAMLKDGWTAKDLSTAAKKVGFPLLIKAAAGGGGRGMRLVEKDSEVEAKAASAAQEAQSAFGSGELFLELYCKQARHIEVQVFGDLHGEVTSFGERDCSSQRRHQKVIEEAPAPGLSDHTRKHLWRASENLARSVGYVNAGTCEYLVDDKENFYFLEMNTRLQVEHPVTELVWGIDLPRMQIESAQGRKLRELLPERPSPRGHAIEARLYAEDPSKNFMPSPGKITEFSSPSLPGLRLDSGYEAGSEVPLFYDAMLAKLIAWGMDREQARTTLISGLEGTRVVGIAWNKNYLIDILKNPCFVESKMHIRFLGEEMGDWKGAVRDLARNPVAAQHTEPGSAASSVISPWVAFFSSSVGKLDGAAVGRSQTAHSPETETETESDNSGPLISEYPGKVLKVHVKSGEKVKKDQVVVVCEAMKMEFSYTAPSSATVKDVKVVEGQVIPAGTLLVEWEAP